MLCEKCKKREASIHMIKVINGKKTEISLCPQCAKELSEIPFNFNNLAKVDNNEIDNLLGGFLDAITKGSPENEDKKEEVFDVVCKSCGLTLSKYKLNGKVGCSECYDSFKTDIEDTLIKIHGDVEHVGKIPKNSYEEINNKKTINKLVKEMQEALVIEDYEKASTLMKLIKKIKGASEEDKDAKRIDYK